MNKKPIGLNEALRLLKAPRRKPDDADHPPSTFGGKKVRFIFGQIDLFSTHYGAQSEGGIADDA
jgi:hypothetical protein